MLGASWSALTLQLTARALVRPALGRDLLALTWSFRRRRWWTSPPFLPVPDRDYIRWRMYTAYGDANAVPSLDDVIRFARWRRQILVLR